MSDAARFSGYRGVVPSVPELVAHLGRLDDVEVQLLRADRVYGVDHLRSAVLHADRAFAEGANVANVWPLEVLRYAAGERQLNRALAFLGLEDGEGTIAAVVRGDDAGFLGLVDTLGWDRDDDVLDGDERVLDAWEVPQGMRALVDRDRWDELVLERVALAALG